MTESNGINLEGFGNTRPAGTNSINETGTWSPATGSFPSAIDKSSQGNAGLGQEGSSASLPLSGPDSSDSLNVRM